MTAQRLRTVIPPPSAVTALARVERDALLGPWVSGISCSARGINRAPAAHYVPHLAPLHRRHEAARGAATSERVPVTGLDNENEPVGRTQSPLCRTQEAP